MIDFYFWQECPSHERALAMLREAMAELGVPEDELAVTDVSDEAIAAAVDFPGSPTIRVNGVDVQDPEGLPRGLTCRLYRHRDGRPSPLPDADDLRDALRTVYGK